MISAFSLFSFLAQHVASKSKQIRYLNVVMMMCNDRFLFHWNLSEIQDTLIRYENRKTNVAVLLNHALIPVKYIDTVVRTACCQ